MAPRQTSALSTNILRCDATAPPFDARFNYREVVGEINFLGKSTRTDITYMMHQCARFSKYPRAYHGDAIIHLVKYLKATITQGIMIDPEGYKSFEVYVDTRFCGNWHRHTSGNDPSMAKSCTG